MKSRFFAAILALSAVAAPATVLARGHASAAKKDFPVTVVDDLGNRVTIASQPKRIVTLDPRDTETLFALGLEKRVVGDGTHLAEGATGVVDAAGKLRNFRYPSEWPSPWGRNYPVLAPQLPHIEGGCCGVPFDLEKVESLRPDLVVSLKTDQPTLQKMRDLGLKLIVLDPSNLKSVIKDMLLVGRATGATKQAKKVTATINAALKKVAARIAKTRSRPLVYYEIDASNPTEPYTAGPGSFIEQGMKLAGGRNVADGVRTCSGKDCYPQFTLEELVKLDPQIILLGDSAFGIKPADVKSRAGWETISAVKNNKIFPFNDELISRAGPRIAIGVQAMARLIHPAAFHR